MAAESTSSSPWAKVLRSYSGNAQGTRRQPNWAGSSSGCSDQEPFRQTAQLTNQLVRIHRNLAGVCVAANMAVLKFSLPPRHSDLDDSCIDEEQINYSQVCTWEGNVEYGTVSSAVLSRKHDNLLTYENEYSLETKARSYMSYTPLGCVAAFNADYEDPSGTCRQAFSRLTALDNALGKMPVHGYMETFLSRYQRGCVVAFGADMDTAASNCTGTKHLERLKTLRDRLGRTQGREKTVEKDL
ncbi:hypothetical protein MTO96_018211 [Rhipicephalus appendiculatus]